LESPVDLSHCRKHQSVVGKNRLILHLRWASATAKFLGKDFGAISSMRVASNSLKNESADDADDADFFWYSIGVNRRHLRAKGLMS
jgi:hypothetical protein